MRVFEGLYSEFQVKVRIWKSRNESFIIYDSFRGRQVVCEREVYEQILVATSRVSEVYRESSRGASII